MRLHRQKGVAAVELAFILVPLLVLCFGIVEVGRALNYYNGVVKATRGAARYLTGQNLNSLVSGTEYAYDINDTVDPDKVVRDAMELAVCGKLPDGAKAACAADSRHVPGFAEGNVRVRTNTNVVTVDSGGNPQGTVSVVTVTVSGVQFSSFLPYGIVDFTFSPVRITMAWSVT